MTREECLIAVSNAFSGASVWAVVGFWNVCIETTPKRELVLSNWFISQNIEKNGLSPEEFTEILQSIKDDEWSKDKNGNLLKSYGFPSNLMSLAKNVFPKA